MRTSKAPLLYQKRQKPSLAYSQIFEKIVKNVSKKFQKIQITKNKNDGCVGAMGSQEAVALPSPKKGYFFKHFFKIYIYYVYI